MSLLSLISKIMESITVDMKSFLFSNGQISDHQFRFKPGHYLGHAAPIPPTMDRGPQCDEIRAVSGDMLRFQCSLASHLALQTLPMASKGNSTWLTNLVYSHSQCVAQRNPFISLLRLEYSEVVLSQVLFLILINNL